MAEPLAGHPLAVTVSGKDGLAYPGPGEVVGKYRVYQNIDVFKDVPAIDPLLIVGGGGGNGEIVPFGAVQ